MTENEFKFCDRYEPFDGYFQKDRILINYSVDDAEIFCP